MMLTQLIKYVPFYTVVALVAFRLGWELNHRISSYAQEIDPRIEKEYTR